MRSIEEAAQIKYKYIIMNEVSADKYLIMLITIFLVIIGQTHILGERKWRSCNRPIGVIPIFASEKLQRTELRLAKKADLKIRNGQRLGVHSCQCWRRCIPQSQCPANHKHWQDLQMWGVRHPSSIHHLGNEGPPWQNVWRESWRIHWLFLRKVRRQHEPIWVSADAEGN